MSVVPMAGWRGRMPLEDGLLSQCMQQQLGVGQRV